MGFGVVIFVIGALLGQASCFPGGKKETNVGILGGHAIPIKDAPYMAAIQYINLTEQWDYLCGASIIHEQFILTAAHCISLNFTYQIVVGTDNKDGYGGDVYEIEELIIHEDKDDEHISDYDVGLIKLKKPLTFSEKVAIIDLAESDLEIANGTLFNATGWGRTTRKPPFFPFMPSPIKKLQQVELPVVDEATCEKKYIDYDAHVNVTWSLKICAGQADVSGCAGDSGGPLTMGSTLVGVTSFGPSFCGDIPGVYTKVSSIYDWIQEKLQ